MSDIKRDLVFLILQFLKEEKYQDTVHMLEKDSGFFFDMKHLDDCVLNGEWEEAERYLSGFTKLEDNKYSFRMFFEIRKQKYLEALDNCDRSKALEILVKDLKVFASSANEVIFTELTELITLENFRENRHLSWYTDAKSTRLLLCAGMKKMIEANPLFRGKLQFPTLEDRRLRTLINHNLYWQHDHCQTPRFNPENDDCLPSLLPPLVNVAPKHVGFQQLAANGPFQLPSLPKIANAPPMAHPAVSGRPIDQSAPPNTAAAHVERPMTPPSSNIVDYHSADQKYTLKKRPRSMVTPDEEDLPKIVAMTLNQGSFVTSMDFHPSQPTILLVGTNVGDILLWNVAFRKKLAHRNFSGWNLPECSELFQAALVKDPSMSVNRVVWNHDGSLFGIAYSKHFVQLYSYNEHDNIIHHLEIDAHVGGVNDLAFSHSHNQLRVVTCGDDKTVKVWDAITGVVQFTFEGHETPVYSICAHSMENVPFIFSISLDGKIKAWVYENLDTKVNYTAPGDWCTSMAYSGDGTRLFSCGTSKEGDTYIVEWNEKDGSMKRTYVGFRKSTGVVQFDLTENGFLAAGDEFLVKFWDMDNTNLLATTDAGGGLPASPRVRFNKIGSLLAVSTNDNCVKILANADGLQLLHLSDNASQTITKAPTAIPLGGVSVASIVGLIEC